jgi:hypothetical protein
MSKTFRYTKFTGHYYCQYSDEWEEDGVDFDYAVDNEKLLPVIVNLLFEDYFEDIDLISDDEELTKLIKTKLSAMVEDGDLVEGFADQYEDTLKEIFQEEAMEWYRS